MLRRIVATSVRQFSSKRLSMTPAKPYETAEAEEEDVEAVKKAEEYWREHKYETPIKK